MTNSSPAPQRPRLEGSVLVTGGSRGIGAATCRRAARHGWSVAVNYARDKAAGQAVVDAIVAEGGRAIALQADVAVEAEVAALFAAIDRELPPLAGLVNNAGVVDLGARVDAMSAERLQRMFAINVFGSFYCARAAIPRMKAGRAGAIVNVSSAAAKLGGAGQYVDYAAAKGAIESFTIGLAKVLAGDGIRVNAVRPGIIATDIHASGGAPDRAAQMAPLVPLQRAGTSEEVAEAIVWLLSEAASYTTGSVLEVTGGR